MGHCGDAVVVFTELGIKSGNGIHHSLQLESLWAAGGNGLTHSKFVLQAKNNSAEEIFSDGSKGICNRVSSEPTNGQETTYITVLQSYS